jgi:2-polyprenyl-6-methoxyphenol hydroxylase-like FAD-dependent oxidoreductase
VKAEQECGMSIADGNADVLVVGAGPVGLTLGCELLRQGVSCRVIDVLEAPVIYSKAAVVHARTMEVFESLGIASAAIERAKIIYGVSVYSEAKRVVHAVLDEMDSPFPHVYGLSQHDTEELLGARACGRASWSAATVPIARSGMSWSCRLKGRPTKRTSCRRTPS